MQCCSAIRRKTAYKWLTVSSVPLISRCRFKKECKYSKIPILRPPFGLLKIGLINEVVLKSNTISLEKYHLGLAKIGLNSEGVLISSGLNSEILLFKQ